MAVRLWFRALISARSSPWARVLSRLPLTVFRDAVAAKDRAAARLRAAEELNTRFAFKVGGAVTVDVDTTLGVNGTGYLPGGHGTVVTRREVQWGYSK